MQESISKDKNKLKILSSLLIIVLLIMGVSFAIFQNYARQSSTNNLGATNCFSVTFEGVNNAINLANDYPIPDDEGLTRSPYTFKVTNNCNQYLSLSIGVETLSTSEIPSNLIKGVIIKNGETPTSASILSSGKTMEAQNSGTAYELLTDGLATNSSKTYDLRLWFDESMTKEQGASKKYQGKVIVGASTDVETPKNFRDAILADNEVKTPLTIRNAEISLDTEALLASTEDDYGTSYYFRGAVINNYVEFANMCWRIVRITGDGSIKLVLNNVNSSGVENPCFASDSNGAFIQGGFPFNTNKDDNAYIGFMYGTPSSNDYATTHANINKSTILTNLETWYKEKLISYESKLADTIWCNDKNVIQGDKVWNPEENTPTANDDGIGKIITTYTSTARLLNSVNGKIDLASLKCPNDNNGGNLSKFTVDDTTNGNGNLTYKIGLLTVDELVYAGYSYNTSNTTVYLQDNATGKFWWTMSPSKFDGTTANIWFIYGGSGTLNADNYGSDFGIRPAISLVSSIEVTGSGTSNDPYKVV